MFFLGTKGRELARRRTTKRSARMRPWLSRFLLVLLVVAGGYLFWENWQLRKQLEKKQDAIAELQIQLKILEEGSRSKE